jgi:hypothetical protein
VLFNSSTYESQAVIVAEWNTLLNVVDGCCEATENFTQVSTHLHGDDAEMIFLIALVYEIKLSDLINGNQE